MVTLQVMTTTCFEKRTREVCIRNGTLPSIDSRQIMQFLISNGIAALKAVRNGRCIFRKLLGLGGW